MGKIVELPTGKRTKRYRFFEILPFACSVTMVVLLVVFSLISPYLGSLYLLIIVIMSFVKAVGVAYRTMQGYKYLEASHKVNWHKRLLDLENPQESYERLAGTRSTSYAYDEHLENLRMMAAAEEGYFPKPSEVYHAVIVTMYNESIEILRPTMEAILATSFDKDKMILVLAYEERGGEAGEKTAQALKREFGSKFKKFILSKHPDGIANEVIGKGGNITYAGHKLAEEVKKMGLRYGDVIVTTVDSDNHPQKNYFDLVAYEYIVHEDRKRLSYEPVSVFTNNIWDAPAVTRVVATSNTFWNVISSMRPHTLRNFASHSQPLDALVEMNFWSVRTIVEDGHQYWRSLFYFDGDYEVIPIRAAMYQDAVLDTTLVKTLKAQWVQLRRWDYGASDVAYVGDYMCSKERKMPLRDLLPKFIRLLDGHVTLAAVSPIVAFGGWVPLLFRFNSRNMIAHNLPYLVGLIQTIAALGLLVSIILSMKMLPPRPKRYKKSKKVIMVLQWILSPIIAIVYSSFAAFHSQSKLAFGHYMEKFDVTVKAVKTDDDVKV